MAGFWKPAEPLACDAFSCKSTTAGQRIRHCREGNAACRSYHEPSPAYGLNRGVHRGKPILLFRTNNSALRSMVPRTVSHASGNSSPNSPLSPSSKR